MAKHRSKMWIVQKRDSAAGGEWGDVTGPMTMQHAILTGAHRFGRLYSLYRLRHRQTDAIITYEQVWS